MWRQYLFVEWSKFEQFDNAIECVCVPVDCLDEAADLWGEWTTREYLEHEAHNQYARATR